MAHLRKKKDHYYAEFYEPQRSPKRKWVTLRTKDKGLAMSKLVALDRRYMTGDYDPWRDAVPNELQLLDEAISLFLSSRSSCRKKTVENYRNILKLFAEGLPPGIQLRAVEKQHVERFLARSSLSRVSRATYYKHLRVFFRWSVKEGLIKDSPLANLDSPQTGRQEAAYLNPKQVKRLIQTIREHTSEKDEEGGNNLWLIDIIVFAVSTGLRRGEITNLQWADINLDDRILVVRSREGAETKSGHERMVPLVADAREVLKRRRSANDEPNAYVFTGVNGDRLNGNYLSKRFRDFRRKTKLAEEIHFHSLRHTCASWLVMKGVSLPIVQAILGHSSVTVTQRYAHLAPDALRSKMEDAFGEIRQETGSSFVEERQEFYICSTNPCRTVQFRANTEHDKVNTESPRIAA